METLTLERLPWAITNLTLDVSEIKRLLLEKSEVSKTNDDQPLNIQEAAAFLRLKPATLYGHVHRGEIPVSKRGNRLYFSRLELTDWVKLGRKKTIKESAIEATAYLQRKEVKNG